MDGLLSSILTTFFPNGIAYEISCEIKPSTCTTDMLSFKSYLTRWLASTILVAPYTRDTIMPYLKTSAVAAAAQCSGGATGRECGLSWSLNSTWDGTTGVGQQMAAMSVIFVNLLDLEDVGVPVTNLTGGTSEGNVNAGSSSVKNPAEITPATTADRAGAGIVTTMVLVGMTVMFGWMSV